MHTPGEWTIHKSIKARNDYAIVAEHFIIAETFWHVGPGMFKAAEANARLIAASPDLLAACEAFMAEVPRLWGDNVSEGQLILAFDADRVSDFEAAIAKAKGEPCQTKSATTAAN